MIFTILVYDIRPHSILSNLIHCPDGGSVLGAHIHHFESKIWHSYRSDVYL